MCPSCYDDIPATFIETVCVESALCETLSTPTHQSYDVIVESIINARIVDDALIAFIKRIVEDAYQAEKCSSIVPVNVKVIMSSEKVFTFQVGEIKTKRLQVVATMKAAIVEGGEIILELYLSRSFKNIPSMETVEISTFCHIRRRYNFSYIDVSREKHEARCFAKYPIESLLKFVFF